MTVAAQTPLKTYTANGVTTVFPYDYLVDDENDMVVTADDVEVTSGFTISGVGNNAGGNVTFLVAPANGVEIALRRHTKLQRETDYQTAGDFKAEVVNADFDRIWQALQEISTAIAEGVIVLNAQAGNVIIIDADGYFSGGDVEAALQELGAALYRGFTMEKNQNAKTGIVINNPDTSANSAAGFDLSTGTVNSTATYTLRDATGNPIVLEKIGAGVTGGKETWSNKHAWRTQDGSQSLVQHIGTVFYVSNAAGDTLIEASIDDVDFVDVGNIGRSGGKTYFNVQDSLNGEYRIDDVKVVGPRHTGWAADTGTAKRTTNATYTGTAEGVYTQATIQALMNEVRDLSQTVKAIKDDLISHGLIGT